MSLHMAVQKNNIEEVRDLLQKEGANVNSRDSHGSTPLHFARDKTIASLLIQACADPNLQNKDGDTALHTLYWINLQQTDFHDFTDPAPERNIEIIYLLLESGASPNIQNDLGYNSLHSLLVYGGIAGLAFDGQYINNLICRLIQFKIDVNMGDFEGCTPLHHAVKEPHVFNAETLITAGALVDARDYRKLTPLHHIFCSDNTDMVQLLLKYKANVNAQDMDSRTMLSMAVEVGNEKMVQLLLQEPQVCVNLADKNSITPLHLAAAFKRVELTEMLIKASSDINARDSRNATPLHYAAYGGTPEIVTLLLEAGADDRITDDAGWLAVQYALCRHYCHTALQFGDEYLRDLHTNSARGQGKIVDTVVDDVILKSLPADDIFTVVVPASQVYTSPALDSSITLDDLVEYTKAKSEGHISRYLRDMSDVPGVGRIPMNISEVGSMKPVVENAPDAGKMGLATANAKSEAHNVKPEADYMKDEFEDIRHNIEKFMTKWKEKIAETDQRFTGALLQSGSVYEGTKVGEPDEFDYMLCLEKLPQICLITFDDVTEYDKVTVHKNLEGFESCYEGFFDGQQLESGKVMRMFVDVAKKALTTLDYSLMPKEMYIEGLTEHTLIEDAWALHGTVTCNLKIKWAGLFYKQLVITVDLVPAIPIVQWPHVARQDSYLLTGDIRFRGCHLVPKSGYWRLSFSLAEKLIMQRLSCEQKSAFVQAKVILHPSVSCKIMVYDDNCALGDDSSVAEDFLQIVGSRDSVEQEDVVECAAGVMQSNREASTWTSKGDDAGSFVESSGTGNKEENRSLSATVVGRTVLSQSGDAVTILQLANSQDWQSLKEQLQNDPDIRITTAFQEQQTSDDGSDVCDESLLPLHVLSTYLLKNLFFNCIEENAKDTEEAVVTTKQIFSKLYNSLKENQSIPYYFMPTQTFCGLDALSDDAPLKVLVARVINTLLSDV